MIIELVKEGRKAAQMRLLMFPAFCQISPVESRKTVVVLGQTGSFQGSSTVS